MRIMQTTNNQQNRQNKPSFTAVKLKETDKLCQLLAVDAIKDIERILTNTVSRKGDNLELEFAQTLPIEGLQAEQYFILRSNGKNSVPYVGSFQFEDLHSSHKSSGFCYKIINTVKTFCGYNV
ncbi:MAG: hypothetical protein WCG95_07690 [bacterium]